MILEKAVLYFSRRLFLSILKFTPSKNQSSYFFIKNASAGSVGQSRISTELLQHIRNLKDRFRLRFSKPYRISSDRAEYFNGVNFRPLR